MPGPMRRPVADLRPETVVWIHVGLIRQVLSNHPAAGPES